MRIPSVCLIIFTVGCSGSENGPDASRSEISSESEFVGRQACIRCHQTENRLWEGSHHDLAMHEATERTVLGDFDDATFTYNGVTTTFFKRDGDFFVRTDGPDGEIQEFEISYTFGAVPLQQYLIAFPGGRYQALSICWDTRPESEGGQRWFHLYPDEAIDHQDPLHWTGIHQNWNYMCAECHSTNLKKNFDLAADRFDTNWSEIDVSCEACHGPGSQHLDWANAGEKDRPRYDNGHYGLAVRLEDPGRGTWLINPETGSGMRLAPPVETQELDTCARCHSRRSLVSEDYEFSRSIMDTHRLVLLEEGLYHADGQILEEVYVHGSFLQSKMYLKGVTCSDCHDPHNAQLHFPGDAVCFRCHSQVKFATKDHHFHQPGTAGSFCVDCHMPPKNYMVVDPRHDHSLRVPRPDLSLELGTPNACSDCHLDKSVRWSADWVAKWYGPDRRAEPRYGEALAAGRERDPGSDRALAAVATDLEMPGIARATALALLADVATPASVNAIDSGLADSDPLVRMGALRALEALPMEQRLSRALPLLSDPVRTIRIEAVRVLVPVPPDAMNEAQRSLFLNGVEEYRQSQMVIAERPEAHLNLGWLESSLGQLDRAESSYQRALERDPDFIPAYINLADLYRMQGREAEGEEQLRRALGRSPETAELHHSLGLLLVRRGQHEEALAALAHAVRLAPEQTRFAYVYAVALHDLGQPEKALQILADAHRSAPTDRNVLMGLVSFSRQAGDVRRTRSYARKLLALDPDNTELQQFVEEFE